MSTPITPNEHEPDPNLYERCPICGGTRKVVLPSGEEATCWGGCGFRSVIETGVTCRQLEMLVTRSLKELGDPTIRDETDEQTIERAKLDVASHSILRLRKILGARKGESLIHAAARVVRRVDAVAELPPDVWHKGPALGGTKPDDTLAGKRIAIRVASADGSRVVTLIGRYFGTGSGDLGIGETREDCKIVALKRLRFWAPLILLMPREEVSLES